VIDSGVLDAAAVIPGSVQAVCGQAAYDYVVMATYAALEGVVNAVVTAPLNKEALQMAGIRYPGHTEIFASLTGSAHYCMMMASKDINVCLTTTHIAHSDERIFDVITLATDAMRRLGAPAPRVTVCGLNPHAGENGLFGDEESRLIMPAVLDARAAGIQVTNPLPPDTAFIDTIRKKTDVYIVMYHDQGLIPFKMLAFDTGVNITLGLPIVRTSVDHGTAFDLAWKGVASYKSMLAAIDTAVRLAEA